MPHDVTTEAYLAVVYIRDEPTFPHQVGFLAKPTPPDGPPTTRPVPPSPESTPWAVAFSLSFPMGELTEAGKKLLRDMLKPHYSGLKPACPRPGCGYKSHYIGPALRPGHRGLGTFECTNPSVQHITTPGYAPTIPPDFLNAIKATNFNDLNTAQAALQRFMDNGAFNTRQVNCLLGMRLVPPHRTKTQLATWGAAYRSLTSAYDKLYDKLHLIMLTDVETERLQDLQQAVAAMAPPYWNEVRRSGATVQDFGWTEEDTGATFQHRNAPLAILGAPSQQMYPSTPSHHACDVTMTPSSSASTSTAVSSGFLSSGSQSSSRRDKGKAPVRASKRPYEQLSSDALSHRHKMSKTYNPEPDIGPFCYQLDHATGPSRSSVTEVDPDLQEIDKSDVFRQMVLVMYPATVEIPGGLRYLLWIDKARDVLCLDKYTKELEANFSLKPTPPKLEYYCVHSGRWFKTGFSEDIPLREVNMLVVRCITAPASDYLQVLKEADGEHNPFQQTLATLVLESQASRPCGFPIPTIVEVTDFNVVAAFSPLSKYRTQTLASFVLESQASRTCGSTIPTIVEVTDFNVVAAFSASSKYQTSRRGPRFPQDLAASPIAVEVSDFDRLVDVHCGIGYSQVANRQDSSAPSRHNPSVVGSSLPIVLPSASPVPLELAILPRHPLQICLKKLAETPNFWERKGHLSLAIEREPELTVALERQWIKDEYLWAVFAPECLVYTGKFACLAFRNKQAPVEFSNGSWGLSDSMKETWRALENNLLHTTRSLMSQSCVSFPLHMRSPNPPSKYGYTRGFGSTQRAQNALWASRTAFLSLMTFCSFLIACSNPLGVDTSDISMMNLREKMPGWARYLLTKKSTPYVWVNALHSSWIACFSVPRIGGFVNTTVTKWQWPECALRVLHRAEIPLWYWFPKSNIEDADPLFHPFFRLPTPPPSPKFSAIEAPPPAAKEAKETSEHRRLWLEQMKQVIVNGVPKAPGRKGPRVFEWEESDLCPGVYAQVAVPRNAVQDKWEDYNDKQKRYDSHRNEWDLCSMLDADGPATSSFEEPFDHDEFGIPLHDAEDISQNVPGADVGAVWKDPTCWLTLPNPDKHDRVHFDSLEVLMTTRYSLRSGAPAPPAPAPVKEIQKVKFSLGFRYEDSTLALDQHTAYIINTLAGKEAPLPTLYDLVGDYQPTVPRGCSFTKSKYADGRTGYRLTSHEGRMPYEIVVDDAVDTLNLIRRGDWVESPSTAIMQMISRGMSLNVLTHTEHRDLPDRPELIPLGWTDENSGASCWDYRHYLFRRAELLDHPAVAHADICSGGIE
ncbi:hypothetical protein NLI96_g12097 [Meripilus lineatus]|uniref:Uncharacterized protein n=1 Tax=Meripilus lineatus TaxID=2056292 RepID=A0AAD5UQQ5_9APHY|nr:hypothetical protein NLI96_g12097 [Physisporinus lineatus]